MRATLSKLSFRQTNYRKVSTDVISFSRHLAALMPKTKTWYTRYASLSMGIHRLLAPFTRLLMRISEARAFNMLDLKNPSGCDPKEANTRKTFTSQHTSMTA